MGRKLSYAERQKLHPSDFALPKERKYPIDHINRARNALARVSAFGTEKEKIIVRRKVYKKFPSLKP